MRLCIQNLSRVWGGNEKWLGLLAEGLLAGGHQVVVSCRAGSAVEAELARRQIPTSRVRPGAVADLPRAIAFLRWLRAEAPDALLLTSWRGIPAGSWAARRAGVPRTVVRLGIVRSPPRWHPATWALRRGVDALIVNAPEIRDTWLSAAPWFPADQVHVVLNAVATPGGPPAAEPGAVPTLVGVGFLEQRKGFDLLLEAAGRIAQARVVLVGSGSQEPALRSQAVRLGMADRVRFTGYRADAQRIIAGGDIFVLPSRNEGMANVMLEAMAAGVPVVAAEVSGVRTALGPDQSGRHAGWMVPPDDAGALEDAIRAVLADPDEARRRAGEASRRVHAWFGVERMVGECERILFPTIRAVPGG